LCCIRARADRAYQRKSGFPAFPFAHRNRLKSASSGVVRARAIDGGDADGGEHQSRVACVLVSQTAMSLFPPRLTDLRDTPCMPGEAHGSLHGAAGNVAAQTSRVSVGITDRVWF
jgi:hypothetical protein